MIKTNNVFEFSFWMQNLAGEEGGSDYAQINGEFTNELEEQIQLKNNISRITKKGKIDTLENDNASITIFSSGQYFVLKIISSFRDNMGRKAPILCYGKIPSPHSNIKFFIEDFFSSFENFIASIGLSFASDVEQKQIKDLIIKSFNILNKKKSKEKQLHCLAALGLGISGTAIAIKLKTSPIIAAMPTILAIGYCFLKYLKNDNERIGG